MSVIEQKQGEGWAAFRGDCVEVLRDIPTASVGYSIFSPPFSSLYTYSNSDRDMGNCANDAEFFGHFAFLVAELTRVLKPGRLVSMHCMPLPTSKSRDGHIGLRDFPGELIRAFEAHTIDGVRQWTYHSEVTIRKDPVTAMQRTKALGLLHKTIRKDSSMSRQGIPDKVITMRKLDPNPEPIAHVGDDTLADVSVWQRYAEPCWMDIDPSDTLQYRSAREHDDERHICPLQLEVIRRCVRLWSNPNDVVLTPFGGIGSEAVVALELRRRALLVELKGSYFEQACKNMLAAHPDAVGAQRSLFGEESACA